MALVLKLQWQGHNTKGLFVVFGEIPCCSRHIMRQALPLKEASKATQRRKQSHPAWKDKDKGKVEGKQYQHGSENPTTELPVTNRYHSHYHMTSG